MAILFHQDIKVTIDNSTVDDEGRFIFLEGQVNDNELALLNYYGPTSDKIQDQIDIMDKIQYYMSKTYHKLVLAGDFNCWLDPKLDKYGKGEMTKTARKLSEILSELELIDIWRILNPNTTRFMWRSKGKRGLQQFRLDYYFVPNSFIYRVGKCEIGPCIYSDHNMIMLDLTSKTNREGEEEGSGK